MRDEFKVFAFIILGILTVGFIAMAMDSDGDRACRMKMVDQGYPVEDIVTLCGK